MVPSPRSDGGFFNAVSARTDTDAWAVGDLSATTPLTARWNGTAWSQVTGPTVTGARNTVLNAVSAASATDAWAAGIGPKGKAVTENWTGGRSWHLVPNPVSGLLLSVTGTGPRNVTAAGHNTTANGPTAAIILSWNGSAWTKVKVPRVGATEELDSASAAPGGTITWAFGRSTNSQGVVSDLTLRNS